MLTDAIRLLLFPALMAFAASSDLFTMTISNRVTLVLVGGLLCAGALQRDEPDAVLWHMAAAALRCWRSPSCSSPAAGSAAATPSLPRRPRFGSVSTTCWPYLLYASIFGGILTLAIIRSG